jgi:hypothetical protein
MASKATLGCWIAVSLALSGVTASADCNGNGIDDAVEVRPPALGFVRAGSVPTPFRLRFLDSADFDGDSDLDLIAALLDSPRAAFLLNDGRGRFRLSSLATLVGSPLRFLLGDLEPDGDVDAVSLTVVGADALLNDGRGGFEGRAFTGQELRTDLSALADFDGDGALDLLSAAGVPPRLFVVKGRGDGSFSPEEPLGLGRGTLLDLAAADLDGDGDVDIVLGEPLGLRSFLNDGRGGLTFDHAVSLESPWIIDAGDADGDGDVDIVAALAGAEESFLFFNDGAGKLREPPSPAGRDARTFVDLDGDADLDLMSWRVVAGESDNRFYFFGAENDGRGRFADDRAIHAFASFPFVLRTGDFDGDGVWDAAAIEPNRSAVLLLRHQPLSDADCDRDGIPDDCEEATGGCAGASTSQACDALTGRVDDCNRNLADDRCEVRTGASADCNGNSIPDECDIAGGASDDRFANGIPDECDSDCDRDGISDRLEIAGGLPDCDENGLPDSCDLADSARFAWETLAIDLLGLPDLPARALLPADLDGDGDADLVAAFGFSLEVFENRGAAGFAHAARHAVGSGPAALAAFDFDRDGDVDVASANALRSNDPGNVAVFENRGGTLVHLGNAGVGEGPMAILGLDPGAGALPGLAVLNRRSGDVSVLVQRAAGRFEEALRLPVGITPRAMAAADLDRDGDDDLAVADAARVTLFFRSGAASFEARRLWPPFDPAGIGAADLDGDGLPELAVASSEGFEIFGNLGGGEFEIQARVKRRMAPLGFTWIDLDGDSRADLAAELDSDQILPFFNRRGAFFVETPPIALPASIWIWTDLEGDGAPDVAALSERGELIVGRGVIGPGAPDCNQNGVPDGCDLRAALRIEEGASLPLDVRYVRAGDLDGDGGDDLVSVNDGQRGLSVFVESGGAFERAGDYLPGVKVLALALLDIDEDLDLDLAASMPANEVVALFNRGDGRAFAEERVRLDDRCLALAAGDVLGDGGTELVVALDRWGETIEDGATGQILEVWERRAGAWAPAFQTSVGCFATDVLVVDFQGDGLRDIAVLGSGDFPSRCGQALTLLSNQGGGRFTRRVVDAAAENVRIDYLNIESADVDGDRLQDLMTPLHVYFSRRGGNFEVTQSCNQSARSFTSADVDGDGDADILHSLFAPGRMDLFACINDGRGRFPESLKVHEERRPFTVSAGDFDGDGLRDLVVGSFEDGFVKVLHNRSQPSLSRDRDFDGVPDECGARPLFHRGDPNADGRADIADAIAVLDHLFVSGKALACEEAGDFDNDGRLIVVDAVAELRFLFQAGPGPAAPGPPGGPCGADPDPEGGEGALGCEDYRACR